MTDFTNDVFEDVRDFESYWSHKNPYYYGPRKNYPNRRGKSILYPGDQRMKNLFYFSNNNYTRNVFSNHNSTEYRRKTGKFNYKNPNYINNLYEYKTRNREFIQDKRNLDNNYETNNSSKVNVKRARSSRFDPVTADQPTASKDNTEYERSPIDKPKISLIPLSKLLRKELLDPNGKDKISSKVTELRTEPKSRETDKSSCQIVKPNLVKRKKLTSTRSSTAEFLVDKLLTMDKGSIKNVINSSDTKYDDVLKTQARKRLREEIRKQLKTINLDQSNSGACSTNIEYVTDEIVEAIHIPELVLKEISAVFGIELLENSERTENTESNNNEIADSKNIPGLLQELRSNTPTSANDEPINGVQQTILEPLTDRRSSMDLKKRIKAAEQLKSLRERSPAKEQEDRMASGTDEASRNSRTSPKLQKLKRAQKRFQSKQKKAQDAKQKNKVSKSNGKLPPAKIIVINSSESSGSSSSSSSSSSSDSDTDSSASQKSDSSSVRRQRQKQKIIAENVAQSFETLILPLLSEAQKKRYREKYSFNIGIKLIYISCICTSEYNSSQFSKTEIAQLQRDLRAQDNATSLTFLMREIVNVFNKQKLLHRLAKEKEAVRNELKEGEQITEDDGKEQRQQHPPATQTSDLMKPQNKQQSTESNKIVKESISIPAAVATTTKLTTDDVDKEASEAIVIKNKSAKTAEKLNTARGTLISKFSKESTDMRRNENTVTIAPHQIVNEQTSENEDAGTVNGPVENSSGNIEASRKVIANPKQVRYYGKSQRDQIIAADTQNLINVRNTRKKGLSKAVDGEAEATDRQQEMEEVIERETVKDKEGDSLVPDDNEEDVTYSNQALAPASQKLHTNSPTEISNIDEVPTEINSNTSIPLSADLSSVHTDHLCSTQERVSTTSSTICGVDNYTISTFATALDNMIQHSSVLLTSEQNTFRAGLPVGEAALSNLRDIDTRLVKLHKHKMSIEELIMNLQKRKMEADLQIFNLQNEKFLLLNTAMTANASLTVSAVSTTGSVSPSTTTSPTNVMEKPSSSIPALAMEIENEPSKDNATKNSTSPSIYEKRKRHSSKDPTSNWKKCRQQAGPASKNFNGEKDTRNCTTMTKTFGEVTKQKLNGSKAEQRWAKSTENHSTEAAASIVRSPPKLITSSPTSAEMANQDVQHSSISCSATDSSVVNGKHSTAYDYSDVPVGTFANFKSPVTQICVFEDSIIASSEDGNLYKFNIRNLKLVKNVAKHSEAITHIYLCQEKKVLYTTSLDGFLKKSSIDNIRQDILTVYLEEPLQSIDIEWGVAFIGSRWGHIFTYDIMRNHLSESILCSSDASIVALKATKEGPRKILIVASKGNLIHLRDATSGLLLRTLNVPTDVHIFSLLLNLCCVYCGTQTNKIYKYDFTTGNQQTIMNCGKGVVSMKLYKSKFLFVGCYDGFVYVLDKDTGVLIGQFRGSGKIVLALEIAGDKVLTSAKDNSMQITDIPAYIVAKTKD